MPDDETDLAEYLATQVCRGFQCHDERDREGAIEAFAAVDRCQFRHVTVDAARAASEAFVEALWAKDAIEGACREDGEIDRALLADLDWTAVESALARRASLLGVHPRYATLTTIGWRRHKVGADYWTPHLRAQQYELRAALAEPGYPDEPRGGESGCGPEPTRYLLGVELHDTRQWEQARDVMVPYFERILEAHGGPGSVEQ